MCVAPWLSLVLRLRWNLRAGQRCTTTRVAYVHEAIYAEFERRLVEGYRGRVRVGDPLTEGVNVGPVFHKGAVERYRRGKLRKSVYSRIL